MRRCERVSAEGDGRDGKASCYRWTRWRKEPGRCGAQALTLITWTRRTCLTPRRHGSARWPPCRQGEPARARASRKQPSPAGACADWLRGWASKRRLDWLGEASREAEAVAVDSKHGVDLPREGEWGFMVGLCVLGGAGALGRCRGCYATGWPSGTGVSSLRSCSGRRLGLPSLR